MALIDHFAQDAGPVEDGGSGVNRLSSHAFATVMAISANGVFGNAAAARARIISEFNLQASDEAQLDLIIAVIVAAPTKADRMAVVRDLEDSFIGYESGHISLAEAAANIGL